MYIGLLAWRELSKFPLFLFQNKVLSLSPIFFLQKIFKFDGLDTELVQTFWLRIVMLLFLFIAGRSVELQY